MNLNSIRYYVKEASKNVFTNGWMSLTSIFMVLASLLVFGLFLVLSVNMNHIAGQLEGDYKIIAVLDETCDEAARASIGETLRSFENVTEVTLDDKEGRLADWKEKFGEDAILLDGYENNNPLRDWYKVTLDDLSRADETVTQIGEIPGIAKTIRNQDTIDKLVKMTGSLGAISVWVMIALTLVSVFIISNTIKLTVYSRHKEINIMKFVGATDWFIRWPFIIEGIMIGLFGAIISYIIVAYGYQGILGMLSGLNISFVTFQPFGELALPLTFIFLLMGVALGGLGSLIAVRKHLKV